MSTDMIPIAMQLGTSALKAHSGMQEGKAAASMYQQQAQAESDVLRGNAAQVRGESMRHEELVRRQGRSALGKQAAAMAQAGIAGTGTGVGVMEQSMVDAELDAMNTNYDGQRKSDSILSDARNTLIAGQNRAEAAKQTAKGGAISELAQGIAGAYGMHRKLKPGANETEEEGLDTNPGSAFRGYDPYMAFGSNPKRYKGRH